MALESGMVGVGTGSGFFCSFCATCSGVTTSTAIGSAVTDPNGCTSASQTTSVRTVRWAIADAVSPVRKICRSFIVPVDVSMPLHPRSPA